MKQIILKVPDAYSDENGLGINTKTVRTKI